MKKIGLFLVAVGLALFLFVVYNIIMEKNRSLSPIPENKGMRVIFISPTTTK